MLFTPGTLVRNHYRRFVAMFYSEYVLAKRGPLAKIWLAAHWNKRLNRAQIQRADVVDACQTIIEPPAKLALRTSGHLLLGVVRIHERKQKSLMNDCTDAFVRIKVRLAAHGHLRLPVLCFLPLR